MESTSLGRTLIHIGASSRNHSTIVPQLPAAHPVTGFDTVAQCFGNGKATVIKCLKSGHSLHKLGDIQAGMDEVIAEAMTFVAAPMAAKRRTLYMMWTWISGKKKWHLAPELKNLPPTTFGIWYECTTSTYSDGHMKFCLWGWSANLGSDMKWLETWRGFKCKCNHQNNSEKMEEGDPKVNWTLKVSVNDSAFQK